VSIHLNDEDFTDKFLENTEVYNIICDSLCLTPNPNNGSLRLPLKPVGLHSPENAASEPLDPVDPTTTTSHGTDAISISPVETSSAADQNDFQPGFIGVNPVEQGDENSPVEDDNKDNAAEEEHKDGLWDFLLGKLKDFKDWVSSLADSGGDPG
jgi:hypothetical protein